MRRELTRWQELFGGGARDLDASGLRRNFAILPVCYRVRDDVAPLLVALMCMLLAYNRGRYGADCGEQVRILHEIRGR